MATLLLTDLSLVANAAGPLPHRIVRGESRLVDEDEFLECNPEDGDVDHTEIRALKAGEFVTCGGGAAGWFEVRRPCESCASVVHADGYCADCNDDTRCVECDRCGCPSSAWCADHWPASTAKIDARVVEMCRAEREERAARAS